MLHLRFMLTEVYLHPHLPTPSMYFSASCICGMHDPDQGAALPSTPERHRSGVMSSNRTT